MRTKFAKNEQIVKMPTKCIKRKSRRVNNFSVIQQVSAKFNNKENGNLFEINA